MFWASLHYAQRRQATAIWNVQLCVRLVRFCRAAHLRYCAGGERIALLSELPDNCATETAEPSLKNPQAIGLLHRPDPSSL
jgi:hypothetical protein